MKEKVILVPTDFSQNGETAVKYSIRLAEDTRSKLVFLHAFRLLQTMPAKDKSPLMIKIEWDSYTADKFQQLEDSYLTNTDIHFEFVTEIGFAEDAIQLSVKNFNVNIIVMGSSGEGKWDGIFGSTTLGIVRNSLCPVVVVPTLATYKRLKHVAFAFDFKPINNANQLQTVIKLLVEQSSTLEIVSIDKQGEISEEQKHRIEPFIQSIDYNYNFIKENDVLKRILTFLNKNSVDLLVVLKRNYTVLKPLFPQSVINRVKLKPKLPITVIC